MSTATAPERKRRGLWPVLVIGVLAAFILNLTLGAVSISPERVLAVVADHIGLDAGSFTFREDAVVWSIRLPRALLAAFVGAGLAMAGAGLQGTLRNPLADPQIIGISAGGALGAVLAIAVGFGFRSMAVVVAAMVFAFAAGLAVLAIGRYQGRTEVATLILTGVAVNALVAAVVGFITFASESREMPDASFWLLGGFSSTTWRAVQLAVGFIALGLVAMPFLARPLNLALLGETEARHLGVEVDRLRIAVLLLTALMTGAAVAAAGIIGFVGLLAPHAIRAVTGPDHRVVLPAAALAGATFVLLADLAARNLASPTEIPVGLITAIVGGPAFLWLLRRTRSEYGEWG